MAIYIKQLYVDGFRGIHQLAIDSTNHVNIVAGDNNCGKTSILEAMLLLRNPTDITNILRVARNRETLIFENTSIYESFISLFPKDSNETSICVRALCKDDTVRFRLVGEQKRILLDREEVGRRRSHIQKQNNMYGLSVEADAFVGEIQCKYGEHEEIVKIDIDAYSTTAGREIKSDYYINMKYLSPFNHIIGSTFKRILRNDSLKEICLNALRLFDPGIQDLLLLPNNEYDRPAEYVKHARLGNMPLSTYGDGIKKVLSLANGIAAAVDGVLFIDEVETAIHTRYYYDIFRFIVKACKKLNVQVFITSHSSEAIDGFLGTQDYDKQSDYDDIQVITLKKDIESGRTYSRVLPGRKVYTNREQFGFEVRL